MGAVGFPTFSQALAELAFAGSTKRRREVDARQAEACARIHLNQPFHAPDNSRGGEGVTLQRRGKAQ